MYSISSPLVAQTLGVTTLDRELDHLVAFHNGYVKVFIAEVSPGDSIVLHGHDQETIATAVGDQPVN
jgi:hypothetical protein